MTEVTALAIAFTPSAVLFLPILVAILWRIDSGPFRIK